MSGAMFARSEDDVALSKLEADLVLVLIEKTTIGTPVPDQAEGIGAPGSLDVPILSETIPCHHRPFWRLGLIEVDSHRGDGLNRAYEDEIGPRDDLLQRGRTSTLRVEAWSRASYGKAEHGDGWRGTTHAAGPRPDPSVGAPRLILPGKRPGKFRGRALEAPAQT
jgi:hypothetical protein